METSGVCWQRTHGHPPDEILELYSMGNSAGTRLSEEECEQVEEHLFFCESCRKQLDQCDQWVSLMRAAAVPERQQKNASASPPILQRWWASVTGLHSWPALAGGMAMLAAVIWVAPYLSAPPGAGGAVSAVSLSAVRGNDLRASVLAGKALELKIEDHEVAGAQIQIVDASGRRVWSGKLQGNVARVPALAKGLHWVRLESASSGEQLKEYGLLVE